jgi:hypothetical protein
MVNATPNIPSVTVPGMTAKIFIAQSLVLPLDPVVVSQSPAHATSNVLATAQIVLQFSKPMNTNAVQAAFSLQPPTAGTFSWSPLGNTMTFTAAGAGFPAQTTNAIHLAATAADAGQRQHAGRAVRYLLCDRRLDVHRLGATDRRHHRTRQ